MTNFLRRAWPSITAFFLFLIISYLMGVSRSADWTVITYTEPSGSARFSQEFFLQASLAFLIALAVYEITERAYQRRKMRMESEASSKVLTATATTVFGQFFDKETIREVTDTIFSLPVVREKMSMNYVFEDHASASSLLKVRVITEYVLRNACPFSVEAPINIMLSNMMASHVNDPNHLDKSRILSLSIDGKDHSARAVSRLNSQIKPTDKVCRLSISGPKIPSDGTIVVRSEVETVKLSNDSEVMQLIFPTKNVEIIVQNSSSKNLAVDINGIRSKPFPKRTVLSKERRIFKWAPSGVFLNHNGWIMYWTDLDRDLSG